MFTNLTVFFICQLICIGRVSRLVCVFRKRLEMNYFQTIECFVVILIAATVTESLSTNSSDENVDAITTICPEKFKKPTFDNFYKNTQAPLTKKKNSKYVTDASTKISDVSTIYHKKNIHSTPNPKNDLGKSSEKKIKDAGRQKQPVEINDSANNSKTIHSIQEKIDINVETSTIQDDTTTVKLEDFSYKHIEKTENSKIHEIQEVAQRFTDVNKGEMTTIAPYHLEKKNVELHNNHGVGGKNKNTENSGDETEELEKTELEKLSDQAPEKFQIYDDDANDISKSLDYVTKYKALIRKAQKIRLKRQSSDYAFYGQQKHNSQGLNGNSRLSLGYNSKAVSPSYSNQSPYYYKKITSNKYIQPGQNYNPLGSFSSSKSYVKSYQLRPQTNQNLRKIPIFHPKLSQNNVNGYQNPSTYIGYPSNDKPYHTSNLENRRQFQVTRQFTSPRPSVRVTRKKFKPSPVFA